MKLSVNGIPLIVCCPSYKRPFVETLLYLPGCRVYVAKSEEAEYQRQNIGKSLDLHTMPDKIQGNLCRVRNWILDQHKNEIVVLIDDDLQKMSYHQGGGRTDLETPEAFAAFITKYTVMALDLGVVLWGVNVNNDPQCYREYTPFSMTSYIGGPFMVHIKTPYRFDETLPLKEDYDFCLQVLNKERKVLRVNKFHYYSKQAASSSSDRKGQPGGCAAYRTLDEERRQLVLLQKKWGDKIVRLDGLETSRNHKSAKNRAFDINPVIHVPIMGV